MCTYRAHPSKADESTAYRATNIGCKGPTLPKRRSARQIQSKREEPVIICYTKQDGMTFRTVRLSSRWDNTQSKRIIECYTKQVRYTKQVHT